MNTESDAVNMKTVPGLEVEEDSKEEGKQRCFGIVPVVS